MAAILNENFECFLTENAPNELEWVDVGVGQQVIVHLKGGMVLSASHDANGKVVFSEVPAGPQTDHERAYPHPAGQRPPKLLSYWPDAATRGKMVGYQP